MSSNKTIIPGMETAYDEQTTFDTQCVNASNGTQVSAPFATAPIATNTGYAPSNQKPIVGFLYSVSRTSSAEFWPVRIGSNSIGRSNDCDISLGEATVSEQHAILVVRQMKNPEKIIASICDARSTCGTMINGESLGFDQRECFNGDIITIGEHYNLYFILIDAKQTGLNVCHNFIPTQENTTAAVPNSNPHAAPAVKNNCTQGFDTNGNSYDPFENKPGTKPGGTIFM